MNGFKLTTKDTILLLLLLVIIVGVVYYISFYTPLQKDLESINSQCVDADNQMLAVANKIGSMNKMQEELDEIFSRPEDEITEIAPYDNAKTVMNFLNGILSRSNEYKLSSPDPKTDDSGIVRRTVTLSFTCSDYATAKSILNDLAGWNYRCLLGNVSVSEVRNKDAERPGIEDNGVSVNATMTFFESTKIS